MVKGLLDLPRLRDDFEKMNKCYEVWDLRRNKIGYLEIAKRLYPRQETKRAIDRVKKQYARAYELICKEKYNPYKFKREPLIIRGSDKQCKTCPDREQCTELCPEMIAIASHDEKYQRESQMQDIGYDSMEDFEKAQINRALKKKKQAEY
jgi:hypothetical protein